MIHCKLNADRGDSYIGMWWWTGTEIIGTKLNPDDGVLDGNLIQPTPDEVKDKSYKGLERGRVLYDTMTMCFQ